MADSIIELRRLRKEYFNVVALADVDLSIPGGEIYGLIGPNGAGKTTLLRILATTLEPTAGCVLLEGKDLWDDPLAARRTTGFMPDFFQVYRDLTVREFLNFFALAHGLRGGERTRRVADVIRLIGLEEKADALCKGLSRGMVQRLGLGRAILHKPRLLLLDEPASGLDPLARKRLFDVLQYVRSGGATIVISSHILAELSDLCTSVGIMDRGVFLEAGPTEQVIRRLLPRRKLQLRVLEGSQAAAVRFLEQRESVSELQTDTMLLRFDFEGDDETVADLLRDLIARNVRVVLFQESASSLHEAYLRIAERSSHVANQ
ncbi:MAG: ABC transporter ATP-binding protein [Phycisphaerae bacterium]|nr:ABC transporter ATP-binding protein [Phycisphaerae bacterium]